MRCSYAVDMGCTGKTKVTRTTDYGYWVQRERKCMKCGEAFTTQERQRVKVFKRAEVTEPAVDTPEPGESPEPEGTDARRGGRFPGGKGCF